MRVRLTCPTLSLGSRAVNLLSAWIQRTPKEAFGAALAEQRQVKNPSGATMELLDVDLPEAPAELRLDLGPIGLLTFAADGTLNARQLRLWAPPRLSSSFRASLGAQREERWRRPEGVVGTMFWVALVPGQPVKVPMPEGTIRLELLSLRARPPR